MGHQIQDQKLQSLVYYNYLKGFVFKYENYEGLIERKYIPANSLSQLLDRLIIFKDQGLTTDINSLKELIDFNKLGELPDNIYSQNSRVVPTITIVITASAGLVCVGGVFLERLEGSVLARSVY